MALAFAPTFRTLVPLGNTLSRLAATVATIAYIVPEGSTANTAGVAAAGLVLQGVSRLTPDRPVATGVVLVISQPPKGRANALVARQVDTRAHMANLAVPIVLAADTLLTRDRRAAYRAQAGKSALAHQDRRRAKHVQQAHINPTTHAETALQEGFHRRRGPLLASRVAADSINQQVAELTVQTVQPDITHPRPDCLAVRHALADITLVGLARHRALVVSGAATPQARVARHHRSAVRVLVGNTVKLGKVRVGTALLVRAQKVALEPHRAPTATEVFSRPLGPLRAPLARLGHTQHKA